MPDVWQKVSEEEIKIGFRRLLKQEFILPDGRKEDYYVKKEGPAVCVLALTTDKKVILAQQFRPGPNQVIMELPGGKGEGDESFEAAAKRELHEETGYTGDFAFVGTSLDDGYSTMVRYNYVATNCIKTGERQLDDNEFIDVVEMPIAEFRHFIKKGQLTDLETAYLGLDYLGEL